MTAEALDMLAYWLANIIDLLEPHVIAVGGSVSRILAPFLSEIRERWIGARMNPPPLSILLLQA